MAEQRSITQAPRECQSIDKYPFDAEDAPQDVERTKRTTRNPKPNVNMHHFTDPSPSPTEYAITYAEGL
jgi:hypothetical protein